MINSIPTPALAFIPSMGWPEMLMIFGVILLIFGPQKLPEIAEALGKSIRKFKSATTEIKHEIESDETRKSKPD
jgi:sec-independent protein translocase protein TatA